MRKSLLGALLLIFGSGHIDAQSTALRLQDVKTIDVRPLGGQDAATANLISAKLISYLAKHREISVVETADGADAILTGTAQIQTTSNASGQESVHLQGAMRLVSKNGVVLWGDDISNSPFAQSPSSSFAENVANRLTKAILSDGDRK